MVGIPEFEREEEFPLNLKRSFVAMAQNSVSSIAYRNLYRQTPRGDEDVIRDGDLACAFFVSSLLHIFSLTNKGVHTWVSTTIADMLESGWVSSSEPREGRIVVWANKKGNEGASHLHIGICLDKLTCISNIASEKAPLIHLIEGYLIGNQGEPRSVVGYYKHPALE